MHVRWSQMSQRSHCTMSPYTGNRQVQEASRFRSLKRYSKLCFEGGGISEGGGEYFLGNIARGEFLGGQI